MERYHGRIFNVYQEFVGSWLEQDAAAAATVLYVNSVSDFSEEGGTIRLKSESNREIATYTSIDLDNESLTGVSARADDYAADDTQVRVVPSAPVRYAEVMFDEADGTTRCRVPIFLQPWLKLGSRGVVDGDAESVLVEYDGEEWVVVDVLGSRAVLSTDHASANRIFRYTSEDIVDGFTGEAFDDYKGSVYGVRVQVGTAASTDTTWDLEQDGVSFVTVTLDAGQVDSGFIPETLDFVPTNAFTVTQTDPGNAGADLVVYFYVRLVVDV